MSYEQEIYDPTTDTTPSGRVEDVTGVDWTEVFPWWHDPDTAPPAYLQNYDHDPRDLGHEPPPGYIWHWTGDHWETQPGSYSNTPPPTTTVTTPNPNTNTPPPTTTTNTPPPTGPGSFRAPSFSLGGGDWPTYSAPVFEDPGVFDPGSPFSYPDFSYRDFVGPKPDQIQDDPSFQWRMDQGRKALEASAAGRGTLRSGGTLKDLMQYGQNFASQEYGNIWDRALREYDTNRDNAFGSWNANRGNAFDEWNSGYTGRKDAYSFGADRAANKNTFNLNNAQFDYNGRMRSTEFDRTQAFNKWLNEGNWLRDIATMSPD